MSEGSVAFSGSADGDMRADAGRRRRFSERHDIPEDWATVRQVHGADVVRVAGPGDAGDGDALFTTVPRVPVAVFTADCAGVAVIGDVGVGVAHAGWRGADAGVVTALVTAMRSAGIRPLRAETGPSIRSCCFEVGPEVTERFPEASATTDRGTPSVDLVSVVRAQLDGLELTLRGGCTHHDPGSFSHRRDGDTRRMATVAWVPEEPR